MFYLYHHHDLDRLALLLAALLEHRKPAHPLAPHTVVVPNHGVGRWLQMRIAEDAGVAANLDMPLLARTIWQLIPQCLPGAPQATDFERSRMRWHLYALLPQVAQENAAVASYLAGEPAPVLRLQLADQLADVFDQYLIYRPSLLTDWQAGRVKDATPDRWQAVVWRALAERLGGDHRGRLLQRFIETIGDPARVGDERLPDPLYCFGLGSLPPEYLRFLVALGQRIDVHFLLPNPCDGYWGDIASRRATIAAPLDDATFPVEPGLEAEHPLLASLGRGTRDLLRVLYSEELAAIQEPELGPAMAYESPTGDTLLARVQAGIIAMAAPPENAVLAAGDASIQVHACHGPLREVQVLQDQLLDLLSRDPQLSTRDIVVMIPRIGDYAPAIHSVFGAAEGGQYLAYSLSDRARSASHAVIQSFQRLLDLPLSRWAASAILELAAVPAVMRRFGLDAAALATVSDWVQSAGVRWGLDANTRTAFGAGGFEQNSWRFGLDRLLLGLAQSDDDALTASVAPWSDLEGGATAALGQFWYLLDRLRAWRDTLQQAAPAALWQQRLNAMADDLFRPDGADSADQAAVDEIRNALAVFSEAADCLGDEPLDWQAVRETLSGALAQPAEAQPFLSGGITFCGLLPLRAVPFKVVCLLGMNDSDFPRHEQNRAFNSLRAAPRLGDHSVRDDDRLVFLQAITAARDVFYISYTGQDAAGGGELPPSPVVGEWLEFLHRHYFAGQTRTDFEDQLLSRQPMHPFDARLFASNPPQPRLFTFAREWQPASRAGYRERIPALAFVDGSQASADPSAAIDLFALRRFFDHPAQTFLRERLQIVFETLDDEIADAEPQQLDGLTGYQLRAELLDNAQRHGQTQVPEQPSELWRARGILPPPPLDGGPFAEQAEQVNALLPIWQRWHTGQATPGWRDIDITIDDQRVLGRIANVWPDGLRSLRPGSLSMKYKLRAWIDYLVLRAAGHTGGLRLAGLDQGAAVEIRAEIDTETARGHLAALLELYQRGQQQPLLFLPSLAETYLSHLGNETSPDDALDKTNKRITDRWSRDYDAENPYFQAIIEHEPPLGAAPGDTEFCDLAEMICEPPFSALAPMTDEASSA